MKLKNQPLTSKKMRSFFSFKYQKLKGQGKPYDQTQWHKVNDFDFCFVSKCLHISNSRTKPAGLDF